MFASPFIVTPMPTSIPTAIAYPVTPDPSFRLTEMPLDAEWEKAEHQVMGDKIKLADPMPTPGTSSEK